MREFGQKQINMEMNASESEEEEERQLLGHYFIYVFIIFCLSNVNMWLTGGITNK